jgi:hypothetical protein
LEEKEALAKLNRERKINRLHQKLAKQEEHARRVLERKRMLGGKSNEDLRLSVGGEVDLEAVESATDEKIFNNRSGSGRSNATDNTFTESQDSIKIDTAILS